MGKQLTEQALHLLKERYLMKNSDGELIENPDDMFRRVAVTVANSDKELEDKFYNMLSNLDFLPNTPTLINSGTGNGGTLSGCFVLPVSDSMIDGEDSIMESAKWWAAIQKFGGGVGTSFSNLRSKGMKIKSTHKHACGAISVLRHYDSITSMVTQAGVRDGANMGILEVSHPEIFEFVKCKEIDKTLKNFNISVAITDAFMKAVKNDEDFNLIDPSTKEITKTFKAKILFDLIIEHAHRNGEPGIVFIDRINKYDPVPCLGKIEATNPCSELPLRPYGSCNLGSINLAHMVTQVDGEATINWEKIGKTVRLAIQFLDNVIDVNSYPLERIKEATQKERNIGLGVMGFADMLIQLGIVYDSQDAVNTAEELMSFIWKESKVASADLADKKGAFPFFDDSKWNKKWKKRVKDRKLRNAMTTTIAPTGTISVIAGVSSAVEPLFKVAYKRRTSIVINPEEVAAGKEPEYKYYTIVSREFERVMKERGLWKDEILEKVYKSDSIQGIKEIPEDIRKLFVTAFDVDYESQIRIVSAFQKWVDSSISKTINFPRNAKVSDVRKAYWLAYNSGCKGISVYRDGSRELQIINKVTDDKTKEVAEIHDKKPRHRPDETEGYTKELLTGCGNLYITINDDEVGLCEIFTHMGKAGGCAICFLDSLSRIISNAIRAGMDVKSIIKSLRGMRCPKVGGIVNGGYGRVLSCSDAMGIALMGYLIKKGLAEKIDMDEMKQALIESKDEHPEAKLELDIYTEKVGTCPKCQATLEYYGGKCGLCLSCGFFECPNG